MNFCEVDIEDYNVRACGIDFAGIVGIGLIGIDETPEETDLEDPAFWVGNLSNGKYFVIRNTRGEYDGGQVIEEEDLTGTVVTGAEHLATIDSTALIENCDFWNAVQSKFWKIVLVTSGGLMYYVQNPVTIYTKVVNLKAINTQGFYQSELKWYDFSNPVILNAPEGIFFGIEPIISEGIFDYTFDYTFE